ncbi:MAG: DNA polymerase III subunit beta, partial [bacterium]|nr:DNA polymerase III subunit beta [bacterium]
MKLLVEKNDLIFATNSVSRISSKTSGVTSGIRIIAEEGRMNLTANDLELGISCEITAQTITAGAIVVPSKIFVEAVRRFPGEEVDIEVQEDRQLVCIKSGFSKVELLGMSSVNFPNLPDINNYSKIFLSQRLLRSMIKQLSFAVSTDDMRPILTGMLWEYKENTFRMVAADGFRVASRKEKVESDNENEFRVVVPGRTIGELIRLLNDVEDLVEVAVGRNHVLVKAGEVTIISRLLEGNYLNVDQYLPNKFHSIIRLKPKALIEAVERASVVAKDGIGGTVRLHIKNGILSLRSQSIEYGSHFEEWPVDDEGDELEIMFSIKVIIDILKAIEHGDIVLSFTGSLGPCIGKS